MVTMEDIESYKAIIAIVGLLITYHVLQYASFKYKEKKLGCEPMFANINDYSFGFRTALEFMKRKRDGEIIDYVHSLFEDGGFDTGSTMIAGRTMINTRDPENIKAILGTQFNDFDLGIRYKQFLPLLGDGIFTLDAQGWKHSRAMLRPQFSREQVAHVQSLELHIQRLFKHIKAEKGQKFDIQDLFFKLTIDTATEFLFGESCSSLVDGLEEGAKTDDDEILEIRKKFPKSFNDSQAILATRAILQDFYWLCNTSQFKYDCKVVHQFTDYYVNKVLNTPTEVLNEKSSGGYTFLYELAKQTRDPKILRDQSLNILLAGRDTTAGLLSFTFYELSRNPEVFKKLQEEIHATFGSGKDARTNEITFESLKKCEYLKAVINETLRLYPSVPINFRTTNKDTSLPRGGGKNGLSPVFMPKGQVVTYFISSCQKNKNIYGKDADVFRPERWFEDSTRKLGWAYLPFNGGPRICLGQQFALTEASYAVTRLVQEFSHIKSYNSEADYPPKKNSQLTMCLQNGAHIALY
ncbi:cytochrome P450 52A12 [[Candida] jaroonii]|uniref:Cytochrome P450 52A12 n=1 Tax=[Candida] jaroonii TaxID=467808 RepID=A0ACA9YEE6_9ASCO|nr:cytochrome P450 52A12 [[Candida] jaroonii]